MPRAPKREHIHRADHYKVIHDCETAPLRGFCGAGTEMSRKPKRDTISLVGPTLILPICLSFFLKSRGKKQRAEQSRAKQSMSGGRNDDELPVPESRQFSFSRSKHVRKKESFIAHVMRGELGAFIGTAAAPRCCCLRRPPQRGNHYVECSTL